MMLNLTLLDDKLAYVQDAEKNNLLIGFIQVWSETQPYVMPCFVSIRSFTL